MPQTIQEASNTKKSIKKHPEDISEAGVANACVLTARSMVNKKCELNIMVEDIDHHITESCANKDISVAELGLTRLVM